MRLFGWTRALAASAVLVATSVAALGQEAAPEPDLKPEAVRKHGLWVKAEEAADAEREKAEPDPKKVERLWDRYEAALERFRTAFEAVDLESWTDATDAEVVASGYFVVADHAIDSDDGALAVRALDLLIERYPDHEYVEWARRSALPRALFVTADVETAAPRFEKLIEEVAPEDRYRLVQKLARMLAASGDLEAARENYLRTLDELKANPLPPTKIGGDFGLPERELDTNRAVAMGIRSEALQVGSTLDGLEVEKVLGGRKGPLRAPEGKLLVLIQVDPTSASASYSVRGINELRKSLDKDTTLLATYTWFNGTMAQVLPQQIFMPGSKGGWVGVEADTYAKVLAKWRTAVKLKGPLYVVAEPDIDNLAKFTGADVRVLDSEGRVAYQGDSIFVGAGPEVRAAVRMILARE